MKYKYIGHIYFLLFAICCLSSTTQALTKAELYSILENYYNINSELLEEWLNRVDPVVLNGDTLPRDRFETDLYGNVTLLEMNYMRVSDPNCLHGIESCKYLRELGILGCSFDMKTIDLSPLKHCFLLSDINLGSNYFKFIDISPLESKRLLFSLDFSKNNLDSIDLSPLQTCTWLHWLYLGNNKLKHLDLSPLAGCDNLRRLHIARNELTELDLAPLESCAFLEELYIYQNQIKHLDLEPIWDLDSMYILDVQGNDLDSASCHQLNIYERTHP